MSDKAESPPLLVVSADPATRRWLESQLAEGHRVQAISPQALEEPARFVDAAGAVIHVARERDETGAEVLRGLPAGRALGLLVGRGVSDGAVAGLLASLDPAWLLDEPVCPRTLRFAVSRSLAGAAGRGARTQHRRAQALLGVSAAIRRVLEQVRQVAPTRASVLILGETGTGKELVARALHEQSPRADRAFVPVNCGALPEALLESELFGAQRGAFTGAERDKRGVLEEADRGTLFLDEVGEMSETLQVKLLRVLETGEIRPLGSTRTRCVDLRIVSATHRDPEVAIAEGRLRQDLFYRLNTVALYVPPLRRRAVDIPFLAQHFAEEFGGGQARHITLGEDFLEGLSRHSFPGNVRELRNAVERAIALAGPDATVTREHLPPGLATPPARPAEGTLRERVERLESEAIREALHRFDGNRTHAAEALGLSRVGLRQKMRRLGLG